MSEASPAIGTLSDRVQLQRRETTREDEGGQAVLYVPLATVWARVRRLTLRQEAASDARGAEVSHSVVLRFRSDLRPGDRIVYRGRHLEILAASDLNGRRTWLSTQCAERVVSG